MQCPHCEEELTGSPCPECGEENPETARFCMHCGWSLEETSEETGSEEKGIEEGDELDLENRTLCPDGTCTGIIMSGRCSECKKTPAEAEKAAEEAEEPEPAEEEPAGENQEETEKPAEAADAGAGKQDV